MFAIDTLPCDVVVDSGLYERIDHPVELRLKAASSVSVYEVTGAGCLSMVASQCHTDVDCVTDRDTHEALLVFVMPGRTAAGVSRRFHIQSGEAHCPSPATVRAVDHVQHQGQSSIEVTTPVGRYVFHKKGGGFASLFDISGHDWISYRPFGGSEGRHRGIPNLVYPEGYFHPGNDGCQSTLLAAGPLHASIRSESVDGKWACRWDVFPAFTRLTVERAAGTYWFLYEGTPGGELNEVNDWMWRSDGTRLGLGERWDGPLPEPEWVAFTSQVARRSLYVVHHEADDLVDSYWPMEHNMTVFGMGRLDLDKFLTAAPARFTVGLVEAVSFDAIRCAVDAVFRPVRVREAPSNA